jgi:serine/threonine protein kinase
VRVLDHACAGVVPYIVFEKIDGEDLATRLQRIGPLSPSELSLVVKQLASALDAVHAAGVIHCDVKLANVMVFEQNGTLEAKLIDFGVARALDEAPIDGDETPSGTIYAMSPEQILRPDEAASHWDLWGLAVLAFTALTGRAPFQGKSMIGVLGAAMQGQREAIDERLAVGRDVDRVFDSAFSIALQDRFGTATEFADALAAALEPCFDEADLVLARISASLLHEDEITRVRKRVPQATTRLHPAVRGDARTEPLRTAPWNNENVVLSNGTARTFADEHELALRKAPLLRRIAAIVNE